MKNSFTLIELIFTIVIIALVFTTIPKVIYSTNLTIKFTLKEDGLFNMMSNMMDVLTQEWDENNTKYYDILVTGNQNVLECNSSANPAIRIGGFYSGDLYSRICPNDENISHIGTDAGETSEEDYDDVDDYNGTETNATKNGNTRYQIYTNVEYVSEWNKNDYDYNNQSLNYKFSTTTENKSNIKFIQNTLHDNKYDKNISHAKYWSANIGLIPQIESEQW